MPSEDEFQKFYRALNPKQKEAVDAIEGPVMVIAGPGTGKTQILTLRVANILAKTDTQADSILALTFTESAAANMRRRLVSLIGSAGYYVNISTFHGFCNSLIQDHSEHFPGIVGGKNATQIDQIDIVREIIVKNEFEYLKPFNDPFLKVRDILSAIRDLKNENMDPDKFDALLKSEKDGFASIPDLYHEKGAHKGKMKGEYRTRLEQLEKNTELLSVYRGYQEALRAKKLYDFEDMILEVIKAFEAKENFLLAVQERFQYILVDEHQDTNGAQNRVLELLASFYPNPNLFVVGDEKQAIFRFQGASLDNFLYFKDKFKGAKLIDLEDNYRSTQLILDSAQSLIEKNKARLGKPLSAKRAKGENKIEVRAFAVPEAELLFLAEKIEERLKAGVPAKEMAVLYRENRDAFPIAGFFERRGIPFAIESDQDVLSDPEIKKLLLLFSAIHRFGDDEKLIEALHIDFLGIEPLDIYALVERRETRGISISKLLARRERLDKYDLEQPDALTAFFAKLREWHRKSRNMPFLNFFEIVIGESGFLNHLLSSPRAFQEIEKLSALFKEVEKTIGGRNDYGLSDFISHINIQKEHRVMIKARFAAIPEAVRLMTAHKAKGLEFDSVFIVGAYNGHWGNKRSHDQFKLPFKTSVDISDMEKNEDERRLFYMALTRARQEVFISYATHSPDGKEQIPAQFIGEIKEEFRGEHPGTVYDDKFLAERGMFFAPPPLPTLRVKDAAFVKELFAKRGLSATALNNYLACPWRYFYVNLVRIPKSQSKAQMYGIAVHSSLERFFNAVKDGQGADDKYLLAEFEARLKKFPLREEDRAAILKKGSVTLSAYYRNYKDAWNYNAVSEYNVRGVVLEEGVTLLGKLDKLEIQPNSKEVVVVDYKTKKPESRNWIEGKTASSTGDYKRQLVFYKLLLDLHPDRKYSMVAGEIDFVEPNERGVFKKERFEIRDSEVAELKTEVLRVARDIRELAFWDRTCGEKDCEYCALRSLLG